MNRLRRVFTNALLLVCVSLQAFAFPTAALADNSVQKDFQILVFGDSLSAAYGIEEEQGWVNLLAEHLELEGYPVSVANASVSGETTAGGLARLPAALEAHQPNLLILELGGNDGLRGLPVPQMRNNLQHMIEMGLQSGADVLLIGIQIPPNYGPRYTEPFYAQFRELADEYQLKSVPFLLEGIADRPELMQDDGVHPIADAQPAVMETVWQTLADMLPVPNS